MLRRSGGVVRRLNAGLSREQWVTRLAPFATLHRSLRQVALAALVALAGAGTLSCESSPGATATPARATTGGGESSAMAIAPAAIAPAAVREPAPAGASRTSRAAVTATSLCAPPIRPPRGSVEKLERIVYTEAGGEPLHLDVTRPRAPGPHPTVVLLHAGGWRRGSRHHMSGVLDRIASLGYAAVAVDYRLAEAPRNVFPAAIADCRCAVRYLRVNGRELGIDSERIAAVGFSAGAHLASMLATASDVPGLDGDCPYEGVSPKVSAAVAFYGPHDLRAGQRVGTHAEPTIANFLGERRRIAPDRAELASPIVHVDPSDAPMLIIHGRRDATVDIDQARRMHDTLSFAGVPSTLVEVERGAHGFSLLPPRRHFPVATCTTFAFLRAWL